jgi:transcriptional regulator with XRE-family HTH domain
VERVNMILTTSEKIRLLCKRQGVTLKEIAEKLDTSSPNLTQKLSRDNFDERDLKAIADALGVEYRSAFILKDGTEL